MFLKWSIIIVNCIQVLAFIFLLYLGYQVFFVSVGDAQEHVDRKIWVQVMSIIILISMSIRFSLTRLKQKKDNSSEN